MQQAPIIENTTIIKSTICCININMLLCSFFSSCMIAAKIKNQCDINMLIISPKVSFFLNLNSFICMLYIIKDIILYRRQ